MGEFFISGETKSRPGVYNQYINRGQGRATGAMVGVVGVPFNASWGPLEKVTIHENAETVREMYGVGGTTDVATALFQGGATKVYCIRLGSAESGTAGTLTLKNESGANAATITALYPGTRDIKVAVRVKVEDTTKELVVYEGTSKLEAFTFAMGDDEITALVEAVVKSNYIKAEAVETDDKTVGIVTATSLASGVDPTITNEDYSACFMLLEAYKFNVLALDTTATAVQTIAQQWVNRVYNDGKLVQTVLGSTYDTEFDTLIANAKAFNDNKVIYSGIYWGDAEGKIVDGYYAGGVIAGLIASTPSNKSVVHSTIPGATTIVPYTNAQYTQAVEAGLLLASYSPSNTVWVDSGVNTLNVLGDEQDEGWKKIRRTTTRFELITRVDETVSPLIGKINCDSDGISMFIQYAQGVLNDMVAEGKLKSGAEIYIDPAKGYESDSAWFVIAVDDIDSLEKAYLQYQFRFSPNS